MMAVGRNDCGAAVRDGERIGLLMFVNAFGMGGTERHVVNLGRTIDRSRFDVHLACFRRWGHFLGEIDNQGLPIREYPIDSLCNHRTVRQQVRFARELRRRAVRIVHTYNFYPNVFALPAARLAGTPIVVASIRDTGVYQTPMQRRVQRLVCRLAHSIVVNAEAVRRWLVGEGFREETIVVIKNGVDLARFAERGDGRRLRRDLGLPEPGRLVVVVSRLHELKGLDDFLKASAAVAAGHPDARFLIVGDRFGARKGAVVHEDAYRAELARLAEQLGIADRVVFTGFRLDVPQLLGEAALSVLPSLSEGLSNSLLEAMAAGAPVVATRVGGTPEAVEDGVSGILVPPRDPAALARAMNAILSDPALAKRLAGAGRSRVADRFSLEGMTRETERLYDLLLRNAGRSGEERPAAGLRREAV